MKNFRDLGFTVNATAFKGEKIKMERVLNCDIVVHDYDISPSKYEGERLTLQVEVKSELRVIFTGSKVLLDTIKQIPRSSFPFKTTIVRENEYFEFT